MGAGIVIPVVLVVVIVPVAFVWARKRFKDAPPDVTDDPSGPRMRLTSNSLRRLASPPWRVVYEIAADKLDGVEHVLIGPAGVFAMQTSIDPLPEATPGDAQAIGRAAVVRGGLDDALKRCAMSSTALVVVHWGLNPADAPASVEIMPGVTAVDGRALEAWADRLQTPAALKPAQVDLAWQTVLVAIGRPDPLA